MANHLSDRIRNTRPCGNCRKSDGIWAIDEESGEPIVGTRCQCLKGRLLHLADQSKRKRQALESAA
jgi:hypothetical protein